MVRTLLATILTTVLALAACAPPSGSRTADILGPEGSATPPAKSPVGTVMEPQGRPNWEHIVMLRLEELVGPTCFAASITDGPGPDLAAVDEAITQAAIETGWLERGRVWVGALDGAVSAFGGDEVIGRGDRLWIVVTQPEPHGREIVRYVTPIGRTIWIAEDVIYPIECADDGSYEPPPPPIPSTESP